jgi:ABC-type uncharacterized transport system substrate-binding protein
MNLKKFCGLVVIGLSCLIASQALAAKKVLVVHSYHAEYDWCQGINESIDKVLRSAGIEYRVFYMDTKRKSSREWKEESGKLAETELNAYSPDVVITVDDDAQEFFAKKHVNDKKNQIVFCGVNAEAAKYGYPANNVTGILERTYADQSLKLIKQIVPSLKKAAYVADDSSTSTLVMSQIQQKAKASPPPVELVGMDQPSTFEQWQQTIQKYDADNSIGALIIPLYHTVKKPDGVSMTASEVMAWTFNHTRKPIVGLWPFSPKDGALCAVVVDPTEHGKVAAQMVVEILGGKKATDLPVVENTQGYVILNVKTAQKLGVQVPYEIMGYANKVIE